MPNVSWWITGSPQSRRTEDIIASKLFVGNLNFQATQSQVEELFGQVGGVVEVFLPVDRATGRPRGFAFVEFEDQEAALEAIEKFDGYEFEGRALRVNEAQDRPSRPNFSRSYQDQGGGGWNSGGGGGGGGRGKYRPKGSRRNARAKKRSL